jgi:hypothetical protein
MKFFVAFLIKTCYTKNIIEIFQYLVSLSHFSSRIEIFLSMATDQLIDDNFLVTLYQMITTSDGLYRTAKYFPLLNSGEFEKVMEKVIDHSIKESDFYFVLKYFPQLGLGQREKLANGVIDRGSLAEISQLMDVSRDCYFPLPPDAAQKVIEKNSDIHMFHLLQYNWRYLSLVQHRTIVERLKKRARIYEQFGFFPKSPEQVVALFPIFEAVFPQMVHLNVDIVRLIIKLAYRCQVKSLFDKHRNQLESMGWLPIVEKRLATVDSLTMLCCGYLQDVAPESLREQFYTIVNVKMEVPYYSIIRKLTCAPDDVTM